MFNGPASQAYKDTALNQGVGARATLSERPSCGSTTIGDLTASSLGKVPFGVACIFGGFSGDTASWAFSDDAYTSQAYGLLHAGVLFNFDVHGGESHQVQSGNGEDDILLNAIEDQSRNRVSYLFPQQQLTVTKQPGTSDTFVDVSPNVGATTIWAGIGEAASLSGIGLFDTYARIKSVIDVISKDKAIDDLISDCLHFDLPSLKCVVDNIGLAADYIVHHPKDALHASGATPTEVAVAASVNKVLLYIAGINVGASFLDGFGNALFGDGLGVIVRNNRHLPTPSGGGDAPTPATYIARDPSGRSVLVQPGGHILDIRSQETFVCLDKTYFVLDSASVPALGMPVNGVAGCIPPTSEQSWNFEPLVPGESFPPGIPPKVILRGRAEDQPDRHPKSWFINADGAIQTIHDGGTYECLADRYPVVWDVPADKVAAWRPIGTTPASCP